MAAQCRNHHAQDARFCVAVPLRGLIAAPEGGEKHGLEQEVFAHGGGGDNGGGGKNPGGEKKSSSGGGCDAGVSGLMLTLVGVFLTRKKA